MADLVLYFHFLYVLCVVAPILVIPIGAALGWNFVRIRALRLIHVSMIAFVVIESAVGVVCPLTWLENSLRGVQGSDRGFVSYWVNRIMFYDGAPWVFGALYALAFFVILMLWVLVPPVKKSTAPRSQ